MKASQKLLNVFSRTSTKRYYHVSFEKSENIKLIPRVPDNFLTRNGYEDNTTKRVCLSTSIEGCLKAMSQNLKGKRLYVYSVELYENDVIVPTIDRVPDAKITGEVWVTKGIMLPIYGVLDVYKAGRAHKYQYGNGNTAELYSWHYKFSKV